MSIAHREAAAAEIERHGLDRALILIRAHAPRVEILILLDQAVADADATRAAEILSQRNPS